MAARPNAPADLVQDLQYLGSPDAQGATAVLASGDFLAG